MLLGHHAYNHPVGRVSLDLRGEHRVVIRQQGGCGQELLELLKYSLTFVRKSEDCILTGEFIQRLSYTSVILDKPPIEVTETKE